MIILIAAVLLNTVHAFETCTPANDYLESALPAPDSTRGDGELPIACVQAAHMGMPVTGYYGFCPSPLGKPTRSHPRACVSEKYVRAVHDTLNDVTDCLGYDAKLAFSTFMLESGAHMNAVGAATDVGIGQLTKTAIDEVNMNAFDRALRLVGISLKPSCQRILPFMTKAASDIGDRCAFMSLPENPARNLVYSVLLLQQNRRVINNLWQRLDVQLPPAVDIERLKTLLAMLAYNSGPAGAVTVLKAYSVQMGKTLVEQHFDFEGAEEGSFARYLKDNFPAADGVTKKRVSKYIGHIMASTRRTDRAAGGFQSCIHSRYLNPPVRTLHTAGKPNSATARGLIKSYTQAAVALFPDCHSFKFAYLGRSLKVQDLNPTLRAAYYQLCSKN